MPLAPLVGREAELERLRGAWERALNGERHLAFLSGEPGIGKTRVALEFAREVERSGAITLYGRCDDDPVVPYEPFVEVLQQLSDGCAPASHMVESARAMLVDLVPALSGTPSNDAPRPPDAATRRLMLFEGVRSVLRGVGSLGPLLLVLDDLHWADADTVRLLRYLARGSWGTPALLLGTFRDTELLAADQPLRAAIADLHSDGVVDHIEVRALDAKQVQAVAERNLNRALTDDEARRFHEASGGNPFFVHELVELVNGNDGAWSMHSLPVAAREVIARRLSRLSPGCREVLTRASVLGTTADLALLRALWDGDAATFAASLGEAAAAGLLVEEDSHYRFAHALIQQTLYQGLPLPDRQQLHLRAARAIEAQLARHVDGRTVVLATHYRRAGDTSPPEEALPHALAAAEAAHAAFALDDAIGWWEWALDLMKALGSDPRTMAQLLERMASALDTVRDQTRTTGYLQQALCLYEETGDPVAIATARSGLGHAHANGNLRTTDLATARVHFEAAAAVFAEASDRRRLATVHGWWAGLGVGTFRLDDMRHMEQARQLSAEVSWGALGAANRVYSGAIAYHLGDFERGLRLFDEVTQEARLRGDVLESGQTAFVAAIMAQRLCDPRLAIERLRPELDGWPAPAAAAPWGIAARLVSALADAGDLPAMQSLAREHTARDEERIEVMVERSAIAFFGGTWDGPVWVEAETAAVNAGRREDRCSRHNLGHWLVRAYRARGEPGEAVAFLEEELASSIAGGSIAHELVARSELAVLHAEAGSTAVASTHASRCRELFAGAAERRGLEGKVLLAEALLTSACEGPDAAAAPFEQAIDVFRRYSTPWLEARAFEDWAIVLLRARKRAEASSKRREAEAVYRGIGAGQPWFDRLAAIAGTSGSRPDCPALPDGLTPREAEVLRLVARGQSSRQIGEELVLSVRTVERHIANIYLKTGTHGRVDAAAYATAHGLVPPCP